MQFCLHECENYVVSISGFLCGVRISLDNGVHVGCGGYPPMFYCVVCVGYSLFELYSIPYLIIYLLIFLNYILFIIAYCNVIAFTQKVFYIFCLYTYVYCLMFYKFYLLTYNLYKKILLCFYKCSFLFKNVCIFIQKIKNFFRTKKSHINV